MKAMKRLPLYAVLLGSLLPLHAIKSQAAGPYTYCVNYPDDPVCAEKPEAAAPESAPEAAAPESAAAATSAAPAGSVLLFASDDCSGSPKKITASTPNLTAQSIRARSFSVASGPPASAWQKAGYLGANVEPVGPSICVSPGWEIAGIRLQGQ